MTDEYKLKEVFSRGMPTITYVDRSRLGLEKILQGAVFKGYTIVAVTGPSKCGKPVLRKRVVPDNVVIKVEGGHVSTEDDFWETIRSQLELPTVSSSAATKQTSSLSEAGSSIGPSIPKLTGKTSKTSQASLVETRHFNGAQKAALLENLRDSGKVLAIGDFHYIARELRSSIVRALKGPVFDGLSVIMLSVPYRAFDVLSAEAEMEGRFTHIAIPKWSDDDLLRIGILGFPAMGLEVNPKIMDALAKESLGSPLLMQSLCAQVCAYNDVFTTETPQHQ
jgi:hypothetical protein